MTDFFYSCCVNADFYNFEVISQWSVVFWVAPAILDGNHEKSSKCLYEVILFSYHLLYLLL